MRFQCERCNEIIDRPEDQDGTGDIFEFRPDDRICCDCFWTLEVEEEEVPQPYDEGHGRPKYPNPQTWKAEQLRKDFEWHDEGEYGRSF